MCNSVMTVVLKPSSFVLMLSFIIYFQDSWIQLVIKSLYKEKCSLVSLNKIHKTSRNWPSCNQHIFRYIGNFWCNLRNFDSCPYNSCWMDLNCFEIHHCSYIVHKLLDKYPSYNLRTLYSIRIAPKWNNFCSCLRRQLFLLQIQGPNLKYFIQSWVGHCLAG